MGPAADCKTGLFDSQSEKTSLKTGILEGDQIPRCQLRQVVQQNRFSGPSGWVPGWWGRCPHRCSCRAALLQLQSCTACSHVLGAQPHLQPPVPGQLVNTSITHPSITHQSHINHTSPITSPQHTGCRSGAAWRPTGREKNGKEPPCLQEKQRGAAACCPLLLLRGQAGRRGELQAAFSPVQLQVDVGCITHLVWLKALLRC